MPIPVGVPTLITRETDLTELPGCLLCVAAELHGTPSLITGHLKDLRPGETGINCAVQLDGQPGTLPIVLPYDKSMVKLLWPRSPSPPRSTSVPWSGTSCASALRPESGPGSSPSSGTTATAGSRPGGCSTPTPPT